ncbi:cadherin egf lag seven-pass g-type receptor 2 [Plakobranchus ocellatus]|uniref:Cadherin egf lag seven-pass g-type receptor 2 n=1 Tax=Plakobranchus ocellatus TaxID=259542 RepID=A0AAV4DL82_9GAST|nr:cadherin egf lag seven-pass g-type receptor 2 [Plakobranchus ocellatus]
MNTGMGFNAATRVSALLADGLAFIFMALQFFAVSPTVSFEIHMSSSDPGGKITDLSLPGAGWHRVEINDIWHNEQTLLPEILYSLRMCQTLNDVEDRQRCCESLQSEPLPLYVRKSWTKSFSSSSYIAQVTSVFPFFVFIHDPQCNFVKKQRHLLRSRLKKKPHENVHKITIQLSRGEVCTRAGKSFLPLSRVIPHHFKGCRIKTFTSLHGMRLISPSPTKDLVFEKEECIKEKSSYLFHLTFSCSWHSRTYIQRIPFLLEIYTDHENDTMSVEKPNKNRPGGQMVRKEKMDIEIKRRVKRQSQGNRAPTFAETQFTEHVPENQAAGFPVITITATDDDPGPAGELTYRMEVSNDRRSLDMFTIDPTSGQVTTTRELDYEEMTRHDFTIIATDGALPESQQRSATAHLTVFVDDVNDWPPMFSKSSERITIPENRAPGNDEFVAAATDRDSGKNAEIRYSILNPGPPNDAFRIDPTTGGVSTRRALDREKVAFYNITIQAMDQGKLSERKSATMSLLVNVKDENDNKPKFEQQNYVLTLREDRPPNNTVEILNVTATDADEGDNSHVSYRLVSQGAQDSVFKINEFTGQLYLTSPLDYETEHEYQLKVWAQDQGQPAEINQTTVLIKVEDVNDNTPEFYEASYSRNVDEDVDVGYRVVKVEAEDKDSRENAEIEYSIVDSNGRPGASLPFDISSTTGWITTNRALDRELESGYTFAVMAKDRGVSPRSASVSVTISLRDVNDNAPEFENKTYETSVSEEAGKGDQVIIVQARDKDEGDNARMSYRITAGNEDDTFQIRTTGGQGVITVNQKLDARKINRYVLTIRVTDVDGLSDTAKVTINVLDTNRFAPEFQRTAQFAFNVSEDVPVGTSVFKVFATDQDRNENARITYSITPQTVFRINPATGDISTRQALNRESESSYILQVTATDNGQPPLSDKANLIVTVKDVNDNKPRFDVKPEFGKPGYTGQVSEAAVTGTQILQISATDDDIGVFGQVRYTFEEGEDGGGAFSIDNQGVIRLAKVVDREEQASYDLVALAVDSDPVNPQTASVVVHIEVTDVNDEPPTFASPDFTVFIEENSPIGTTVAEITATDPDEGANARVEYSLVPSADSDSFSLSGRLGDPAIITTLVSLDYESGKTRYELTLKAESYPKFSTARVVILLQDVNDNVPVLKDFTIIFNNFQDAFPSGPIGRIPAYDPDVSDQNKLVYKILAGNEAGLLRINETSGELTLDPGLDSDVPRSGVFQMSVSGECLHSKNCMGLKTL